MASKLLDRETVVAKLNAIAASWGGEPLSDNAAKNASLDKLNATYRRMAKQGERCGEVQS